MNQALFRTDVQDFINENYRADVSKIVFKGSPFQEISVQELAVQLTGKQKAEKKLPLWFQTRGIIYPPGLNLEQTSSQITASYKASLIDGESLIDLTGGFGIDSYFFSKKFKQVIHCELNSDLSKLVYHNSRVLKADNILTHTGDGIEYLKNSTQKFSWIYVDPSRRDNSGGRVFHLSDCLPDVPEHLDLFFARSSGVMVKTSPLLDLQAGISALKKVREIHIIAVENDVKELLWLLEENASEKIKIRTVNFRKQGTETYEADFGTNSKVEYSKPLSYLYEPNAAIMKSGLFDHLGQHYLLHKLHPNSHLFTSQELKEFPGRCFEILDTYPYNKKKLKKALNFGKANITTRNFPESVAEIRKKLNLKDGGRHYLFFTTTGNNEKICIVCQKS